MSFRTYPYCLEYNSIVWRCRLKLFKFRQFRQELLDNYSRFNNQKASSFKNLLNKHFSQGSCLSDGGIQ